MKRITFSIIAMILLPAMAHAKTAECEYEPESADPLGDEKVIRTVWERIQGGIGPLANSRTIREIQASSDGGVITLGLRLTVRSQYYPIPPELDIKLEETNIITKKGKFDPRLKPYVAELQKEQFFIESGSELRITLEDRTDFVLATSEELTFFGDVTMPQWDDNTSDEYRVTFHTTTRYALDEHAIKMLSANRVAGMRMELPYGYLYLGSRGGTGGNRDISEKAAAIIQGALKCVM
jgi:hypothetical protein